MSNVPEETAMGMTIGHGLENVAKETIRTTVPETGETCFDYGGAKYALRCPLPENDPAGYQYMGQVTHEGRTCGLYLIIG